MNTGPHLQPGLSGRPWDVPGASDPMGLGAGPPPACDPGAGLMTPALSGTLCLVCIAPRAAGSSFPPAKVAPPRLWTPLLPSPVRTVQMPCPHCGRGASRCRPAPLTPPPCLPLNTPLPSSCFYSNKRDGGLTALPSTTARTPGPTPGALPSQPPVGDQASLASPTTQSTSGPSNSLGRHQASQLSFHLHDPGTYTGRPHQHGPRWAQDLRSPRTLRPADCLGEGGWHSALLWMLPDTTLPHGHKLASSQEGLAEGGDGSPQGPVRGFP